MSLLRRWGSWWCCITTAPAATLPLAFLRRRLLLSSDARRQDYSNEQRCREDRDTLQTHRH